MVGTLLSIGHGYSARALARLIVPMGWRVFGTTRSKERFPTLSKEGVTPILWPGDDLTEAIANSTHVVSSVPPGTHRDPVLADLRDVFASRAKRLTWVGYLSTVGVYGDRAGGWVDEETEPAPSTERGRLRLAAEREWLDLGRETGLAVHIFRLAGIYGPGRGPFQKVRNGTARRIVKSGQVFSRIHVDDIAGVLMASMQSPRGQGIYNVCDDEPAPPQDVLVHAAHLLGLPAPPEIPFDTAELSPMARSFYAESKRVSNRRIKEELGVTLSYPDYRSGLAAVLAAEAL